MGAGFSNENFKILVINLDRRADRRLYIDSLLRKNGLLYTRVPAVDGKQFMNITEVCESEHYPDLSCMGTDDRTGHLAHTGCYLSHLKCLKIAMKFSGRTLILEDDAVFIVDDIKNALRTVLNASPEADIIWLNADKEHGIVQKSVMPTWGLQGYIVNEKAARTLYSMLVPGSPWISKIHNCLIDWVVPLAVKDSGLRWKVFSLVSQKLEFGSNIRNS